MRFRILLLPILLFVYSLSFSQSFDYNANDFNKWSIDGFVGLTKPYRSFSEGYWSPKIGLLSSDIGVRYMFNEYLGLKYGVGYNYYHSAKNSKEFDTDQVLMSLQAVVNAGRLLNMESLANNFNILAHAGFGKGNLKYDRPNITRNDVDHVFNVLAGVTGQLNLSKRFALNMDITGLVNLSQDHSSFDGGEPNQFEAGIIFNGTIGISYYLGKKKTHADWYLRDEANYNRIYTDVSNLNQKIEEYDNEVEEMSNELEEVKSQIELIDDQIKKKEELVIDTDDDLSGDLVFNTLANNGYCDIYFDFNSSKLDKSSFGTISFLANYMKNNPGLVVTLKGFADDLGDEKYNLKLSMQRAEEVHKYLFELGISKERLVVKGKGVDENLGQGSSFTRKFARRVSVEVY